MTLSTRHFLDCDTCKGRGLVPSTWRDCDEPCTDCELGRLIARNRITVTITEPTD